MIYTHTWSKQLVSYCFVRALQWLRANCQTFAAPAVSPLPCLKVLGMTLSAFSSRRNDLRREISCISQNGKICISHSHANSVRAVLVAVKKFLSTDTIDWHSSWYCCKSLLKYVRCTCGFQGLLNTLVGRAGYIAHVIILLKSREK
jgi:hypothetical protein